MRYHRIRQSVKAEEVEVRQIGTKDMLADAFTKNMTVKEFRRMREAIMGHSEKPNLPRDLKIRLGYSTV